MLKKEIFHYPDYRDFLNEVFEASKKSKSSAASLQVFANRVGVSKSYFRYVISKQRHISLEQIPKFAKAFRLSREQKQAFTYMVLRDASKDPETKKFFHAVLSGLADKGIGHSLSPTVEVSAKNDFIVHSWIELVIHSLAKQALFQPEPDWIHSVLRNKKVTKKQIADALENLIESKSIVQDESGRWKPSNFVFRRPENLPLTFFKICQIGMHAVMPVTEEPENYYPLAFSMITLSFDNDSAPKMKEILEECRNSLIRVSQTVTEPTGVVMVNLNFACMADSSGVG